MCLHQLRHPLAHLHCHPDSPLQQALSFTLSHLSSAALALFSEICLLCPKFRVGNQSVLFSSSRLAGLPDRKCLEQILSFASTLSVRSALFIAERKPVHLFLLSFSLASPLFMRILGILKKDTSLSRPDRLVQPKTIQRTMLSYQLPVHHYRLSRDLEYII